jgi:peptidyl-prolyl cis-trans isomerase A (cyclophilin A)
MTFGATSRAPATARIHQSSHARAIAAREGSVRQLAGFENCAECHERSQIYHMYRVLVLAVFLAMTASPCLAFRVKFDVSVPSGDASFVMNVDPQWAPIGAARFKELVQSKFFDGCRFFRVIPGFMAQIGINGDPALSAEWRSKTINDEPVLKSNLRGYVSFAKTGAPNSRTTQFFINYGDNSRLDGMGFAPFGIIEDNGALCDTLRGDVLCVHVCAGMDVVDKIYNIGERPQQGEIQVGGRLPCV